MLGNNLLQSLAILFSGLLFISLNGCALPIPAYHVSTKAWKDIELDQPWLSPGIKAEAYMTRVTYSLGNSEERLEWVDRKKHTVAMAHKVVVQCQKYLDKQGLWDQMRGDRIKLFESLPRPFPHELLVTPSRDRYSHIKFTGMKVPGYNEVLVIVCLDPVVVVQGAEAIRYASGMPGFAIFPIGDSPPRGVYYFLPWGFSYGTIVPYSKDPVWFSPDMKHGPQSATYVDEDTREIVVPWGKLVLERQGNNWIVKTRVKKTAE